MARVISYDRVRFHGVWRLFRNHVLGQYAHNDFIRDTGVLRLLGRWRF